MQTFFDGILASISRFDLIDALDILLVAVMIYYLLKLASRSRAMQVLKGIGLVFIASRLTELFRLQAVTWIFNYLINAGALVLIVLFQPEIRRGLEQIGRGKFLDPLQNHEGMETSGELIRARVDIAESNRYSKAAGAAALKALLDGGHITVRQYLERLPDGIIPGKESLIEELKAKENENA